MRIYKETPSRLKVLWRKAETWACSNTLSLKLKKQVKFLQQNVVKPLMQKVTAFVTLICWLSLLMLVVVSSVVIQVLVLSLTELMRHLCEALKSCPPVAGGIL